MDLDRISKTVDQLRSCPDDSTATLLGRGNQADVYLAQCDDQAVVIKLYRNTDETHHPVVEQEFGALETLKRASAANSHLEIETPAPLFHFPEQAALAMTFVNGTPLYKSLDNCRAEKITSVGQTIYSFLESFWAIGQRPYGDITCANITLNQHDRLGFIDPGMPSSIYLCPEAPDDFYPASRDLAYFAYSIASTVRIQGFKLRLQRNLQSLARQVTSHHLESLPTAALRGGFLSEMRQCIDTHLQSLETEFNPKGLWRILVRRVAMKRLCTILRELPTARSSDVNKGYSSKHTQSAPSREPTAASSKSSDGSGILGQQTHLAAREAL